MEKLATLDFFPKIQDEVKVKTTSSAIGDVCVFCCLVPELQCAHCSNAFLVTIIVGVVMSYLMISEFIFYTNGTITSEVGVDITYNAKLPINFGILIHQSLKTWAWQVF